VHAYACVIIIMIIRSDQILQGLVVGVSVSEWMVAAVVFYFQRAEKKKSCTEPPRGGYMGLWCLSWGDRPEFQLYLDSVFDSVFGPNKIY
jgi:hypothetical protein